MEIEALEELTVATWRILLHHEMQLKDSSEHSDRLFYLADIRWFCGFYEGIANDQEGSREKACSRTA